MKGDRAEKELSSSHREVAERWNISRWCSSNDPVSYEAAWNARTRFLRQYSNKELEDLTTTLDRQLAEGWEIVKDHFSAGVHDGKSVFNEPDTVDLLLFLHERGRWGNKDKAKGKYPVEAAEILLHLLCLSESRKGNFGLAIKAYLVATSVRARQAFEEAGLSHSRGGKAPKRRQGIWKLTLGYVRANPQITAGQAWNKFPSSHAELEIDGYSVYRDGKTLVQRDPEGREKKLARSSYDRYVADAKKEISK
jgi:hypothetical protein